MDELIKILPKTEAVPLGLRALYEGFGYNKYRMGKFEPYDLYRENKEFLDSDGIITFTDVTGRLMALRPDVTMSIVKNAQTDSLPRKYYYNENVFRYDNVVGECREINQIGLEYLGADPGYAEAEVVSLAVMTLAELSSEYTLDISHMGLISGLLTAAGIDGSMRDEAMQFLRRKNAGGLSALAERLSVRGDMRDVLVAAANFRMRMCDALESIESFAVAADVSEAIAELRSLYKTLEALGVADRVYVDFSVLNDLNYYNGLLFRGYIREVPQAVLSGGRYDKLVCRFGGVGAALGFALYLGELDRVFYEHSEYDVDTLLVYGELPPEEVAAAVLDMRSRGTSVRAEKRVTSSVRARSIVYLDEKGRSRDA